MRDFLILFVHLIATVARLTGPGGLRAVVAESVLIRHQLLILNRGRKRAPNLCTADRILAGLCALFIRPARAFRSAMVLTPSTLLHFHSLLCKRKYRQLFSSKRRCLPGPKGPNKELVDAVIAMKRCNPSWGCPRIAQHISLVFGIATDSESRPTRMSSAEFRVCITARNRIPVALPGLHFSATQRTASGVAFCSGANRPRSELIGSSS